MAVVGTATLDFGASGSAFNSVAVTGQASILTSSVAEAFFMGDTSTDHTVEDHIITGSLCKLICSSLVAGTGFTIFASAEQTLYGKYTVHWVWT